MFLRFAFTAVVLFSAPAHAGSETTRDSMDRLEEILQLRIEDGRLLPEEVLPAILVSTKPRYKDSVDWFSTRAIEVLQQNFGDSGFRLCEACMAPRAFVEQGNLTYQTGPISLDEVVRLDEKSRGSARPAKTAIWIDEHRGGVSIRIVDLSTARVLFAQNVDPMLVEHKNTRRTYKLSEEYERRARGASLTQAFVDVGLFPGQHLSLDWTDQWGKRNQNLAGLTLTVLDPIIGLGANYHRRLPFLNILIGAKVAVSVPTALAQSISGDSGLNVIDPLVTGIAIVRVPLPRSNYGAILTASTNGQFCIGISLMNVSLIPVIP